MVAMLPLLIAVPMMARAQTAACPQRLVTLGGDVTETVFALGAGACVVADDTTSDYPPRAQGLPKVGYLRALNAEGVLALRPGFVLGSADAGPPAVVAQLRAAGVRVVLVPEAHTAAGTLEKVQTIANDLGRADAGRALVAAMRTQLDALAAELAGVHKRVHVLFLLTVGGGSPLAAGRDTAADGIIRLAGGVNVVQQFTGYKPLDAEALAGLAPDVILVMTQGLKAYGGEAGVFALPGVKLTPAGRNHRIVAMDGSLLLGFGPRLATAARALAARLYPQLTDAKTAGAGRGDGAR